MNKLVIGILAHVDSGKTTLTEAMMYQSGAIRSLGRVDHGDAFLDNNIIERERGITIFSKQAILSYADTQITILDTPGHIDFSTETERVLGVLDYAVLIVSGSDGVQNHTETLWRLLERYNVPAFIFVNKMDLPSDKSALMEEIRFRLGDGCIDFTGDINSEKTMDALSMCDETLMNSYLEKGVIKTEDIRNAIARRRVFPCYFGSALKTEGVKEFMEGFALYTRQMIYDDSFGARVFKIAREDGARLTFMKITGGRLDVKTELSGKGKQEWKEKVNQIRIYNGEKYTTADSAEAGTVCAVTGLSKTYAGEGLGAENDGKNAVLESVLTYRLNLGDSIDEHRAITELRKLQEEDPQLKIIWNEQLREIHVKVMGEVQLEVLTRLIHDRFGFDVTFSQGSIAYKETIAAPVLGVGHYEPLRHYAEVQLLMEPTERGSGLTFDVDCPPNTLDTNWQRLILTHLMEKEHIGVLTGSPITDMKITLVAGRAHIKHTEGGDFRQATYRAVRQGLKMAQSVLLEPYYEFIMEVPTENVGRAMTDIQNMGGSFEPPENRGDMTVIKGGAPVAKMSGYSGDITAYTGGRGRLNCILRGYEECREADKVIEEIGYNADSDFENTADSVFCSHGAGYNVKWDQVYDHAHLELLNLDDEAEETIEESAKRYVKEAISDNELMDIFERTYGKVVQKRAPEVIKKNMEEKEWKYKPKRAAKGEEYLLVDGYNIIFAWDELKKLAKDSLDAARDRLVDILCNYQGIKRCNIILVFDAYKVKGNRGSAEKIHNISVVYTKEAETADMYIEKHTRALSKNHRVRVATSDATEQIIILGGGAIRISAGEFLKEVKEAENAIRKIILG